MPQNALQMLLQRAHWPVGERFRRFQNVRIPRFTRRVILQTLLTPLQGNLTRLQIALRQVWRQHGMFTRQRGHRVDMFDDELAVRHPELHIRQIVRVKAGLLHRLIQRVEQGVMRLVDLHPLIRQRGGLRIVAQDQADSLLVGLQRVVGVLPEQAALPLWPQPDHTTKGNQTANQGIDKPGDNKLFAIERKQLQGVYRRDRKAHHRPAVVFADDQVAHQGNQ